MKKILSFLTIALWLCSMSTFATTVKAKMPSDWGTTISVWVWPDGGQGTAYPTTKEGDWFVYTSTQSSFNIIFRNGNDWNNGQTVDIKITGDVCLQINEGSGNRTYAVMDCESGEVEPVVTKNIEVRAYSPNAAPHIYWWNCSEIPSPASWGERPQMTPVSEKEGWYSYIFEGLAEAEVLNFNLSSENGQSGDLTATANVCYDARTISAPVVIADCQTPGEGGDEPGGDDPQPVAAHYLIGNAEAMGSWNIDNALPMENDEIVLNLEAGSYAFKIVATKGWDQPGQLDCNNLAAGQEKLSCLGDANNISFTMPSAAEVTIKVVENQVYVLGIPDGEIEIPDTHYLIGDADVMGAWQINDAVFMENDEIELTLPAGTYMFKIVATKGWDQPGQLDCNNLAPGQANVGCEGEGTAQKNVKFTLAEEATITIKVENNLIYVLGIPEASVETKNIEIRAYSLGFTPKIHFWGNDGIVGSDWNNLPDMIADTEHEGWFSYSFENAVASQGINFLFKNGELQSDDLHTDADVCYDVRNVLQAVVLANCEIGGDDPQPQTNYYLIGSMLGWDLTKAIPLENGQITKMIEAEDVGEYEFRLLPQNDGWDNGLGFTDINTECSSEGLKAGAEYNNIKAYFGEGEVKVQIVDGKLCITGNFEDPGVEPGDEPGEATWYIHGYINGNDYVGNDYPFAEGVATLPELTADSYIYLHKDNGTAAGVDFWTNGWTEGAETVTMTENPTPYGDKMLVPVGTQSVYMCENADGTLKVSRVALDCSEEEPGDTPQPEHTYYLIGSMMGWNLANAMPMDGDSIARMMEEEDFGTYEFKVLPQNTSWDNQLNFSAVNTECSSANIFEGAQDNNIKVAVYDACEWKIKVVNGQLCITGIFIDPSTAPVETKDIAIRAYSPNATPKIHFWGNDSIAGSDWENLPDMIADPENEGWYIYNFTHAVKEQGINFLFKVGDAQSADLHTTGDICYDVREVTQATHLQDCQISGGDEPQACNWDDIEFLGSSDPAYANQFKLCKEGENPGVVNIQSSFGTEIGIYVTFPSAAFGAISLPEGKYAIQGSGMLLYLSAFSAQETAVSVVCQEVEYDFVVYNANGEAVQPGQHTYTVAGSAAEVFGEAWKPSLTDNDMIKLAGDTYAWKKENITLPAGAIEFKVVEDHSWDNGSYPSGDNYSLNIPESGIYTINITFDAESKDIEAVANKTGEAVVMPVVQLAGDMTEWQTNPVTLTPAEGNLTASVTVALEAQDYLFKIVSGGNWLTKEGEWGNYTLYREMSTADHVNVIGGTGNDLLLRADVAGEYTFTWTYADSTLAITFPAASGCNWDDIEFLGSSDPAYANQFKLCKEGENPGVVNIQSSFGTEIGIYVTFPSAAFGAISLPEGKYAIQGSGMLLYLSAFSAQETAVSVVCQEVEYDFVVYNANGEAPQPGEHTYTVAGSSEDVFGAAWNPALEANDMVKQEDGTYKWEKAANTLPAGAIEFKVVEDHSWDNGSYPSGDNYSLNIPESGIYTITITFAPANDNAITAVATKTGEAVVMPVVQLAGDMTEWQTNPVDLTPAEDKLTASVTVALEAQDYLFKIVSGGNWLTKEGEWGNYTLYREMSTADHVNVIGGTGNDLLLRADVAGEYTFTWTYADSTLAITFPEAPAPGERTVAVMGSMNEWSAAIPFTLSEDKESASLFVEDMDEDTYEFKMLVDGDWRSNGWTYHREFTGASGITENSEGNMILITDVRGSYKITWTFANDSLGFEFPAAPAPAKYYITGDSALVKDAADLGKDKAWAPKAIRATTDTTILNLKADVEYKLKITLDGDWNTGRGKSSLSEVPEGITTDDDDNIIFTLAEAGEVKVIYFVEGEVTTYKVLGNFKHEAPQPGDQTYYLAGTMTNWGEGRLAFVEGVVTVEMEQSEEAAAFKIIKTVGEQDTWYGNNGTMTEDNCTGWKFETSADNAHLTLSKSGLYTFNLTLNEQGEIHISVVYPSGETGIEAIMNAENAPAKFIYNGQLFIRKAGRLFNAQGQLVR